MIKFLSESFGLDLGKQLLRAICAPFFVSSSEVLKLTDGVRSEALAQPWNIDTKVSLTECELSDNVPRTLGTQCLIYLFDPGNGWIRDSKRRGDMLLMTAKLVEKGVRLDGIFYYRGNPHVHDQSILQTVQTLINRRDDDPPAELNEEIKRVFTEAGYNFIYPNESSANPTPPK